MMSNRDHFISESDSWRAQLAALIKQWEAPHITAIADILDLILKSEPVLSPLTSEDSIMLSIVVGDALKGVNIAEKYPAFFLRLLENKALLDDFLDTLNLLKQTQTNRLPPLPAPPSRDLSFLRKHPQPKVKEMITLTTGWRVTLQQTIRELQLLFFPLPPQFDTRERRGDSLEEDEWFPVFRKDVYMADTQWTLSLGGRMIDDIESSLSLDISVTPEEGVDEIPHLTATVQWGTYNDSITIGPRGRATFPPSPFDAILDENTNTIRADLQVTIEASHPPAAAL